MSDRLGLGLHTDSPPTFSSFFIGENAPMLERAKQGSRVWLWGEPAVGKSHVLKALAHENSDAVFIEDCSQALPQEIDSTLLLIDSFDERLGGQDQEFEVFTAFEATDFEVTRWVVAANSQPTQVHVKMADLTSRLRMFESVQVQAVGESEHAELLQFWAKDRQLRLPEDTLRYLLPRIGRSQQTLWQALKQMDDAVTLEDSDLTIPFVRSVLGLA